MEVKYIYGIINGAQEGFLGPCGIAAHEEVYTIPYRDISAVVSDSSFIDYSTLPKDEVARYRIRHQRVIERAKDSYAIIPMRLGTYVLNTGEVEELLSKGYMKFKDILKRMESKMEIDVAETESDLNSVIKEVDEDRRFERRLR